MPQANMSENTIKDKFTIIFWWIVILYLDPGGLLDTNFRGPLLYLSQNFILSFILLYLYKRKNNESNMYLLSERSIRFYIYIMIIWNIYYSLWFYGLNNLYYPGFLQVFTHNARMIGQGLLVIPIIYFTVSSSDYFLEKTSVITIIVLVLFFISAYTPFKILEVFVYDRGFMSKDRFFLYGIGLIYFSLPIFISYFVLSFKRNYKIVFAGLLVVVYIFITVTRRDIIGILEYLIIISILIGLSSKILFLQKTFYFFRLKYIYIYLFLIISAYIINSKAVSSIEDNIVVSFRTLVGLESYGTKDDMRLSFTENYRITNAIQNNLWGGTGFDPAWMNSEGGDYGWEGADFVFLSCFAMYGIVGLLIFFPFYFVVLYGIISGIKMIRNNWDILSMNKVKFNTLLILFFASSSEFIKNIIEYPNWFIPIGMLNGTQLYFIYLGLLYGSYYGIRNEINKLNIKSYEN